MVQRISLLIVSFIFSVSVSAQVITTVPAIPTANQALTIYFHTDLEPVGRPLHNYTGELYVHAGVIIAGNSAWQNVIGTWGNNTTQPKLVYEGTYTYKLVIAPELFTFYGVSTDQIIQKVALVVRSADASKQTIDYFVNVYAEGLNVSFTKPPDQFNLVSSGQAIPVEVDATLADSAHLYLDDTLLASFTSYPYVTTITAAGNHLHELISRAWHGNDIVADTVWYLAKGTPQNYPVPAGLKDGITYTGDQSATFVLYAPYKQYIYLIGDFNGWMPDSAYLLNKDGNRFWITLTGIEAGREYAFQYLIDGNLRIADPYCDKILDPWNDKYIPATIYPGLKAYPEGKTSEIAGIFQTAQPEYSWQATGFVPPAKDTLVIYELLIRDFTASMDIKTVTDSLAYLKRLGVNAIELMPFSEFEGNNSWGYNPDFYFAPDKAYGTKTEYKQFIDECHRNGIAVIMDMVLNHTYGQSPMVRMYFDGSKPTAQNPWYNVTSPNTSYSWGNDFNHESQATKDFVDRVTSYWLTEYKIDGFRFDFSKGFTNTAGDGWAYDASRIAILERMADAIWAINPDAYVILEHFTDNTEEKVLANYGCMLWGNMNYTYSEASMGYNESGKSDMGWISYVNRGWDGPNLVGYMESHDEERLMYRDVTYGNKAGAYNIKNLNTALQRQKLTSSFFYTIPGPKMIYEFGELGFGFSINSFGDRTAIKPPHWEYYGIPERRALYNLSAGLIRLKKTEPVFSTGQYNLDVADSIKQIQLNDGFTFVVVVGNFGMLSHQVVVDFETPGMYYSHFTGDSINVGALDPAISIKPGEFRLYSNRKLNGFASVITSVPGISSGPSFIRIFPNPASDMIYLDSNEDITSAVIYSMDGRICVRQDYEVQHSIDISSLRQGLYLLKASKRNGEQALIKFIRQ